MQEVVLQLLGDHHIASFEKLQANDIGAILAWVNAHAIAAKAFGFEKFVDILHQEWIVNRST